MWRELSKVREALHYGRLVKVVFDREFSLTIGNEYGFGFTRETFNEMLLGKLSAWKKRYPSLRYKSDQIVSHFDLLFKYEYISSLFPEFVNSLSIDLSEFIKDVKLINVTEEELKLAILMGSPVIRLYKGDWRKTQPAETITNTQVDSTFHVRIEQIEDALIGYFKSTKDEFVKEMISVYEARDNAKEKSDILIRLLYEYLSTDEYMHLPRSVLETFEYDISFRDQHKGERIDVEIVEYEGNRPVPRGKTKYTVEPSPVSIHALQAFFDVVMYLYYTEQKTKFIVASRDSLIEKYTQTTEEDLSDVALITHERVREITGLPKEKVSRILRAFEELTSIKLIFKRSEDDKTIVSPLRECIRREISGCVITMYEINYYFLLLNLQSYILALRNSFTKLSELDLPSRLMPLAYKILLYLNNRKNSGVATLNVEEFAKLHPHRLAQRREWTKLRESIEKILEEIKKGQIIADYSEIEKGFKVWFP